MGSQTDIERIGSQIWLRDVLASGRALEIVQRAGLTFADVGEWCYVSTPTAWSWLHGRIQRPRREHGERLARLLQQLEVRTRA